MIKDSLVSTEISGCLYKLTKTIEMELSMNKTIQMGADSRRLYRIGEVFTRDGVTIKVVASRFVCKGCYYEGNCYEDYNCCNQYHMDKKGRRIKSSDPKFVIIFKEVKKSCGLMGFFKRLFSIGG